MNKKILLVDGNSIINRAFFGLGPNARLTAPDGTPTGAVLTFFNILLKHLKASESTHVVAAFDRPEPTFRHLESEDYKATRKGMPDELAAQMPVLKACLAALGIQQVELPGFEADDLIGTFARQAAEEGLDVDILSGDKDSFQLIRDNVHVIMPGAKASLGDTLYDRGQFHERYGITPEQFIDVKAIMGDSSDNIPGVKGIGEKGALSLISLYGSLDGVYEHIDEIKGAMQKKLIEQKEEAYHSRMLATIRLDVPLDLDLEAAEIPETYPADALGVFQSYGFQSLIPRFGLDKAAAAAPEARNHADGIHASFTYEPLAKTFSWYREPVVTRAGFEAILGLLKGRDPGSAVSLCVKYGLNKAGHEGRALALLKDEDEILLASEVGRDDLAALTAVLAERRLELVGYDLKNWLRLTKVSTKLQVFDIMSASYLLSLQDQFAEEDKLIDALSGGQAPAMNWKESAAREDDAQDEAMAWQQELEQAAVRSAFWAAVFYEPFHESIRERGLEKLADNTDMPLTVVLANIENRGILVDLQVLEELKTDFTKQIDELEADIYQLAGRAFTINSTKQLGEVLYEDLGLPSGKKGKSGSYSTAQAELDRLRHLHPIIDKIEVYRNLTKLRSTFIDGLTRFIDPADGRIHSTFSQNFTTTGRLSSRDPNLQNIPVRQEAGREIRKAFVAAPGYVLLDADYSQIELRLLAELSGDPTLIRAYQQNADIHKLTATQIFGVAESEVSSELRSRAKTINFSIVYGISDFGLSQRLGLTVSEAHTYIQNYYAAFPAVRPFMDQQIDLARERGYSETLFGRRRYIPELGSKNRNLRQFGERVAMNAPVQGTAADIIRQAMVDCARKLEESEIDGELVSQVHDELILEVRLEDADKAARILQESMEGAVQLRVPMVAEVSRGANWFEAK